MSKKLIVRIANGLGNQLFLYASAYALAKQLDRELLIDEESGFLNEERNIKYELGNFNIRVNAICPGSVSGSRMDRVIKAMAKSTNHNEKKIRKSLDSTTSIKGFVSKVDIANMCTFLISEAAKKISGQVFPIDGNTERIS